MKQALLATLILIATTSVSAATQDATAITERDTPKTAPSKEGSDKVTPGSTKDATANRERDTPKTAPTKDATGTVTPAPTKDATPVQGRAPARAKQPAPQEPRKTPPAPAPEVEEEIAVVATPGKKRRKSGRLSKSHGKESGEEIVVTGVRRQTTLLKTSHPVAVVCSRELRERAPASVGEAIAEVPGVSLFSKGAVLINPYIRGLGGRRVLMLLDGSIILTTRNMGVVGYFLDMNDVDHIEVVRGPASVLFGSGALGGAINIVSQGPSTFKTGFSGMAAAYFGLNNNEAMGYLRNTYNTGTSFISLGLRYRRADDYTAGGGEAVPSSMFEDGNLYLKAGTQFGAHRFTFDLRSYLGREIGKAEDDEDRDKLRRIHFPEDNTHRAALSYGYKGTGIVRQAGAALYYSQTSRIQSSDIYTGGYDHLLNYTKKYGEVWTAGGMGNLHLRVASHTRLTMGFDLSNMHFDSDRETFLEDWSNPGVYNSLGRSAEFKDASQVHGGLFAQLQHTLGPVSLSLALRGDLQHTSGYHPLDMDTSSGEWVARETTNAAPSGNLGLVWHALPYLAVKANIASAYRAPDLRELYICGVTSYGYTCGNLDLKPERSYNIDGGILLRRKGFHAELSGFAYHVRDFIGFGPVTAEDDAPDACSLIYRNTQRALLTGVEFSLRKTFPVAGKSLKVAPFIKGSYIHAKDLDSGDPMPQIPPLSLTGGMRIFGKKYPGFGRYFVQISGRYDAAQNRTGPGELSSESFALLNARAGVILPLTRVVDSVAFSVIGTNLLDRRYTTHLSTPLKMGRQIKFTFDIRY